MNVFFSDKEKKWFKLVYINMKNDHVFFLV